ncbi:hypothetical protein AC249_AIPGENE7931 [Exaiptasia diaphana]|nr:hypothetical protein AC249_AIPGENE7931 [Exaiptasia diaphana]
MRPAVKGESIAGARNPDGWRLSLQRLGILWNYISKVQSNGWWMWWKKCLNGGTQFCYNKFPICRCRLGFSGKNCQTGPTNTVNRPSHANVSLQCYACSSSMKNCQGVSRQCVLPNTRCAKIHLGRKSNNQGLHVTNSLHQLLFAASKLQDKLLYGTPLQ